MEPSDFPTPAPTPIGEFSPSLANQLLSCQLRVGFSRDPRYSEWKRPSTHAALGLIAHAVTEAAFRMHDWPQDPSARRQRLENLWAQETQGQSARIAKAWAPATPPPAEDWPAYALTRIRTIRRAEKQVENATPGRVKTTRGRVEVRLRDESSKLFGRADRIEHVGQATRVIDLKTGLHQAEPSEEQRRQLLLYAVLIHRVEGQWPISIDVEDASGNTYSQPLVPEEAEAALAEAIAAVDSFNQAVAESRLLAVAEPGPDRCRWCDFRVMCAPFWKALRTDWGQRAAAGSIVGRGDSPASPYVTIELDYPRDLAGTDLHISGLAAPVSPDATKAAATDWVGTAGAQDSRARWSTTIRVW